jgi:predicted nucleic acid-binding protein
MVFADTFYWIALTLPGDAAHARAHQVTDDILTTEEVLRRCEKIVVSC